MFGQDGESGDVTTNQKFAQIGPHLMFTDAIFGHSLYDLSQGTGNKVIYAPICSYSMFYSSIV